MWRKPLVMILPCILSVAFLGAHLQKSTDFRLTLLLSYHIDDPWFPNQNYSGSSATSTLVFVGSYGILLFIVGRERPCHCSPRVQNHYRIPRRSGIQCQRLWKYQWTTP